MAIRYSNGSGRLHDKELERPIAEIQYQLLETNPTRYTTKKWWGEFSTKRELKKRNNCMIEFEDGRKGDCIITSSSTATKSRVTFRYHYSFYGRGPIDRRSSFMRRL